MRALTLALVALHAACALALFLHVCLQLHLARGARRRKAPAPPPEPAEWPAVTVQLPVYNEKLVVEQLVDQAAALRYPGALEIQVLDDSTDETTALAAARVALHRARGVRISHVRRAERRGYKAGALAHGLELATGELVAVFDADFLPPEDFLLRTVPHFGDGGVGMVQARWGFANRDESLLTRVQALMLDGHFGVEQRGRAERGCFINFNGTAGVWRAAAVRGAGNWDAGTLTEDVDLSYRAQLAGWRFVFLDDVVVPSELPADVPALRAQQFRWMKGVAQNAARLLPRLLRAELAPGVKLHACAHLLESTLYVAIVVMIALTPVLVALRAWEVAGWWPFFNPALFVSSAGLAVVYWLPQRGRVRGVRGVAGFFGVWLSFFVLTMGLALHNALAVAGGYRARGGEFVRTPKRLVGGVRRAGYAAAGPDRMVAADLVFWLYLSAALAWGALEGVLYLLWFPAVAWVGLTAVLAGALPLPARALRRESQAGAVPAP